MPGDCAVRKNRLCENLEFRRKLAAFAGIDELDGAAIPGFSLEDCAEIFGDELDRNVTWTGGDPGKYAGQPLRLRFHLRDADLYSFKFDP